MREENQLKETETVYYLTMVTMNILLLAVISGGVWIIYKTISKSELLQMISYGEFYQ